MFKNTVDKSASSIVLLNMFNSYTDKGVETRGRILSTALNAFREKGFEATTMRDIAAGSGMSLGAAYHYFPTKDAIVMAYYVQVSQEHARRVEAALPGTRSLSERLAIAFHTKLDIVKDDRPLLGALLRFTGQPSHPLSFLGRATRDVQLHSIAIFASALDEVSLPPEIEALAPVALWAAHMGILLFFLYDESPNQQRTRRLVDGGVTLFTATLRIARLPGFRAIPRKVFRLLDDAGLVPRAEDLARLTADRSLPATNPET